jgi:dolichol-phosphate mannosyltransferase
MQKLLKLDFVRFCIVGALGFVINFAILTLLYRKLHSPVFISQLIAGEIALFSNFLFHHHWTYKANKVRKTLTRLIIQFHVTSWIAVVGSAFIVSAGVHIFHLHYFIALVVASALAMAWNFGWSKFVIWRKHTPTDDVKEENQEE